MSDPTTPRLLADVRHDGSAILDLGGQQRHLQPGPFDATRTSIAAHAAEAARNLGTPVQVAITGADGAWDITVHADGNVTDVLQVEPSRPLIDAVPMTPPAGPATDGAAGHEGAQELASTSEHAGPRPAASSPSLPFAPDEVGRSSEADGSDEIDEDTVLTPPRPEGPPASPALPLTAPAAAGAPPHPEAAQPIASVPRASAPAPAPASAPAPAPAPQPTPQAAASAEFNSMIAEPATADLAEQRAPMPAHGQPQSVPQPPQGQQSFGQPPHLQQPHGQPAQGQPAQGQPAQGQPTQVQQTQGDLAQQQHGDQSRQSFLRAEQREEPAQTGLRGTLNRMGLRVGPGAAELTVRDDERAVSQHWPGPRTIAVVNGKGGAGKTPTTVLLSAVFAQYGGAGVLAWDNNQTRGTLGWRTEQGPHESTLLELLPETDRLLGTGAQSADLARFVHHQAQDKFDVLRSKPMRLAHENRISSDDVDAIHAVAAKFYRLIIIDSGNDESDPMWGRMIDLADQIVVATTTRADHAEAGALLLEALAQRDERSARLARDSVVVVSQADPKASKADVDAVFGGYGPLARGVVRIPFDQSIVDGRLRLGALRPDTRRAWLSAAASVARGL